MGGSAGDIGRFAPGGFDDGTGYAPSNRGFGAATVPCGSGNQVPGPAFGHGSTGGCRPVVPGTLGGTATTRTVVVSARPVDTRRSSAVGPGAAGPVVSRAASARTLLYLVGPASEAVTGAVISTSAPPTRNTPARRPSGRSAQRIRPVVIRTV